MSEVSERMKKNAYNCELVRKSAFNCRSINYVNIIIIKNSNLIFSDRLDVITFYLKDMEAYRMLAYLSKQSIYTNFLVNWTFWILHTEI